MKRVIQLAFIGTLVCAGAWAQTTISTVRVGTSVEGPIFFVDGRQYNSTQVFLWPAGSKHTVQFLLSVNTETGDTLAYQYSGNGTVRYGFAGWKTNGPVLTPTGATEQVVTASPSITEVIGQVVVEYKVRIQLFGSAPGDSDCLNSPGSSSGDSLRAGVVYIDGICIGDSRDMFLTAGPHRLNAFPFPGFVFTGWSWNGQQRDAYLTEIDVQGSVQIIPQFMPAKRVRFSSNPGGLKIIVDGTVIQLPPGPPRDQLPQGNLDAFCLPDYTRLPPNPPLGLTPMCTGDFDFLPGSPHRIGAPQSQRDDTGLWWVFAGFSNGLKQNEIYIPDQRVSTPDLITANFVAGVPATFLTSPAGLKLDIDGRQNWPNYNFIWGAGETHSVSAPAMQTDSRGRKYQFAGWSNKGAASQEITVPNDRYAGITLTATYQILGQVQITTTPLGLKITVDGSECTTPCTFDRESGAQLQAAVPRTVPTSALARYEFEAWTNGQTTPAIGVTFNTDVQVLRASFRSAYLLTANSDPAGQVTFNFSPNSADGFFTEGTQVTVNAAPKGGYRFRRWDGDLNGTFSTGYLNMTSPRTIIARLDRVPFIPPAGVKNAAGETPGGTVAPGSIIAVYGENLASALEVGRVNPLAQTLGNVTVTVGERLLPLLFVSPKQINAQVLSDLPDGQYVLKVKQVGQPDVTAEFTVRRNSPGLFTQSTESGAPLALALHEDGTLITPESPARRRETVSLFGTGFGPYEPRVIDGFIVPSDALYRLADSLTVVSGELSLEPQWTGAAPGMVGTAVVKLKIGDEVPGGSTLDVSVAINGVQSNSVQLPVE
jgi:uncharacterized protein (TIGR03437 family)